MRYLILEIGCICCSTPSNVVGIVASEEEAAKLSNWIECGQGCTQYCCRYFPISDTDYINEAQYRHVIERGRKAVEEREKRLFSMKNKEVNKEVNMKK
jgi:hypothetical protein